MTPKPLLPFQARCGALGAVVGATLWLGVAGCHAPSPTKKVASSAAPWFQDVSAQSGLNFSHNPATSSDYFLPESMSAGAALLDFYGDGRLDILLLQGCGTGSKLVNGLYHQKPDGRFSDVTKGSGLDIAGFGMGASAGDINNDGFPDVLLCGFSGVRLFLNTRGGHFRDITREAGLNNPNWAVSAAFFDYDRDGRLDLVVANYVAYVPKVCPDASGQPDYCSPSVFDGSPSRLFHNQSGNGKIRFSDVSDKSGVGREAGSALGVTTLDFSGDGWPDIFITQDARPNRLLVNNRNGTFQDAALRNGIALSNAGVPQANMGIALGSLNNSPTPSVYVTHLGEEGNTLWSPLGTGLFQDRTAQAGLAATSARSTGFGAVMADFNNDGSPDLAVVNGRVQRRNGQVAPKIAPDVGEHWNPYAETNQLFEGVQGGKFREISTSNAPFCAAPNIGRGLTCGDIWNDGGMALLSTPINGPTRLLRSVAASKGRWIGIRAIDPRLGGRDAYGARLTLEAGTHKQTAWINPAYSMGCSNDPRAHFGLGSVGTIERLEVLWPDGKRETFSQLTVDRINTIERGQGQPAS